MPHFCRTKIVATLGPASDSPRVLDRMLAAGLDVARVNFSHGTYDDHARRVRTLRELAARRGVPLAILADLQGPKLRFGATPGGKPLELRRGDRLSILTGPAPEAGRTDGAPWVTTPLRRLDRDAKPGDRILVGDGAPALVVRAARPGRVECDVRAAGTLRPRQGMNLPGVSLVASALTAKDLRDLEAAVRLRADYVALSFVRRAADLRKLRRRLRDLGARVPVIAKIEKPEALDALDAILEASDGIMVARGDLGVELAPERVPLVQKRLIAAANRRGIPVITATQMLESMIANLRPTRAEASDVANAVLDGTDAVMLSGETAVGQYPAEAVAMMDAIAREAETSPAAFGACGPEGTRERGWGATLAHAAALAARESEAKAIVVYTRSGATALLVSKCRPAHPLVALTPDPRVRARLALVWGVRPILMPVGRSTDEMIALGDRALLRTGCFRRGDPVVVLAGRSHPGATNMMKIHRVGDGARG